VTVSFRVKDELSIMNEGHSSAGVRFCLARHCWQCADVGDPTAQPLNPAWAQSAPETGTAPAAKLPITATPQGFSPKANANKTTLQDPGRSPARVGVILVGVNPQLRALMRALLSNPCEFHLCGLFPTGAAALRRIPNTNARVAVLELALPDGCGLKCARDLLGRAPALRTVVVMTLHRPEFIARAIAAGVSVCLVPPVLPGQLLGALRFASQGPPRQSQPLRRAAPVAANDARTEGARSGSVLNERESQVVQLLGQGLLYKEIADRLQISEAVLKKLQHHAFHKLHAHNRTEASNKWRHLAS
jgi:DNA-binding NarL/FixJ family response regulator